MTDVASLTPRNFLSLKTEDSLGQINRWYTLILEQTCQEIKINLKR